MNPYSGAISRRPWWLAAVLRWSGADPGETRWIAWDHSIFPDARYWAFPNSDAWIPLAAHENHHLFQQAEIGQWTWLAKYLSDNAFKLEQEAEAIAVELSEIDCDEARVARLNEYGVQLSGPEYGKCAASYQLARLSILAAAERLNLMV